MIRTSLAVICSVGAFSLASTFVHSDKNFYLIGRDNRIYFRDIASQFPENLKWVEIS